MNNNTNQKLFPISLNNTQQSRAVAEGVDIPVEELSKNIQDHQTVRNANPYIVARKGVNLQSTIAKHGITTMNSSTEALNKTTEPSPIMQDKKLSEKKTNLNTPSNSTVSDTTKKTKEMTKKFKPKPTATIPGADDNSKVTVHSVKPTRTPPLGMPTKMTYVMPVIVTILILPLFVLSVIYAYKHGRDCWSKRHYRRMDFLIDGMYNE